MAYKYLDQSGLSILWSKIKNNFGAVDGITFGGNIAPMNNKIVNIPVFGPSLAGTTAASLVPAPSAAATTTHFLKADGTWAQPVGSTYTTGTGLTLSGTTFSHIAGIGSSGTIGSSSNTSGLTIAVPYATYDSMGHITAKGTHNHTISAATTAAAGAMTTAQVSKLNGIAANAEVNQNAFTNVVVGSSTVAADSKTDTLTFTAGTNITLAADTAADKITISSTNTTYGIFGGASTASAGTSGLVPAPVKRTGSAVSYLSDAGAWEVPNITMISTNDASERTTDINSVTLAGSKGISVTMGNAAAAIMHTNSVTASTAGTTAATSGASLAVPYVAYDAQGHVTASGTHTHTIGSLAASAITSGTFATARIPSLPASIITSGTFATARMPFLPSNASPLMDGTAASGTSTSFARGDHRHPTDTSRAPLASPNLTGIPTAPTASASSTATMIANKKYVDDAIAAAKTNAATFQGKATTSSPSTADIYTAGYYWLVAEAGNYINNSIYCQPGDMIFAISSTTTEITGSTADFTVIQQNLSPMDQTDINAATPLG